MQGTLLDPYTGRPVRRDLVDPELRDRLPDHIVASLAASRARPYWEQPKATKQGFNEVLVAAIADGTQILNSTAEAILFPDYVFAGNDPHMYPGATFRITCYYDVTFVATTPGTLTFRLRWGGVAGTVLAASGAYAPDPTGALANRSGWVEFLLTVRSIGAAGSMFAMGRMQMNDFDDASATTLQGNLAMTSFGSAGANTPAVVAALDTTSAKNLSVTAQFSVNTATTQITGHLMTLECLN
jgi:hypothetical protein